MSDDASRFRRDSANAWQVPAGESEPDEPAALPDKPRLDETRSKAVKYQAVAAAYFGIVSSS